MFTDETNKDPSINNQFFVYGGLFFPIEQLDFIDKNILQIRNEFGYSKTDILKFDTNFRPENLSIDDVTKAKEKVIDICIEAKCKFIVYIISHVILKNQKPDQYIPQAADYVIGSYNYYLDNYGND